jgi:nucleoside-diphosphate-sugar epimerase
MKILDNLSSGFIGSALCRELAAGGTHSVYPLLREGSQGRAPQGTAEPVVYTGDISRLTSDLSQRGIDGIVHLASLFLAQHTPADIAPLIESNLLLGTHLIEAAAGSGVGWFINTSSFWQHYGNSGYSPVALYAATKQAYEDILQYYRETAPVRIVTLELFDTYGPGDTRPKLFRLLKNLIGSPAPLAMSPGEQRMNLLYIDDVVAAYRNLVDRLGAGGVLAEKYCASATDLPTLRQVVTLFSEILGQKLQIEWGGRPYREREFMNPEPVYPPVPGWHPRFSLAEGMAMMVALDAEAVRGN